MAVKVLTYRLTSSAPYLMHNGQLADPLNKWSRAIKQIASKRKKTDADLEEMARLEFHGGLYLTKDGPAIPANNLKAMLVAAAKKHKEGPLALAGARVNGHSRLEYTGARDADEMWKAGTFRDRRGVRVGQSRVMRTRPIFETWQTVVSITVDDEIVNPSRVDDWMNTAGRIVGIGELRPDLGIFTVERINAA